MARPTVTSAPLASPISTKKEFYIGVALAVVTALIWSGNYVVARGIYKQLPPVSLAFHRWLLASICIAPLAWRKFLQERKPIWQNKSYLIWTAICGITIFNTFIYIAGHFTSAINLALIGTTSAPVFAAFLAVIFLKERMSSLRITGMAICILGILYLLSAGSWEKLTKFHFGKGDLLILISAFSFAIYNTLVRKKPSSISPIVFLFVVFSIGTFFLFPFYIYEWYHQPRVQWNLNIILIIIYLGIGNSIIAFFCWNASIARLGASGTALFANLIPVFSTIEAVLFLGEEFSMVHLVSGVLVISGLVIANLFVSRKDAKETQRR
ncbi:MAG: EamA/RhaT family transporter [Bacteroidetes bacterium]|nr:MAG: EamA/RhaT family transporter [Bacteroidota bacterium]